jgi:hypothetical protein
VNRYERVTVTIANDPVLKAEGLEHVYRSTATDDPTEACFAVLRWAEVTPELPEVFDAPQTLVVWLYDEAGLDSVDAMLPRLREIMLGLVGADGVQQVRWIGDSGDLWDDRWEKDTRNATFEVH